MVGGGSPADFNGSIDDVDPSFDVAPAVVTDIDPAASSSDEAGALDSISVDSEVLPGDPVVQPARRTTMHDHRPRVVIFIVIVVAIVQA